MKRIILILVIYIFLSPKIHAQEENLISLYIYNFTRYIDWPSGDQNNNFVIDVIGHKSVFEKLKEYTANRKAGNRSIEVRYLESVNGITKSDILFIGFWQSKDIGKVIEKVGNNKTLIIGEKDGLIDGGVGINFVIRGESIKFDIKVSNIQRYGLKISNDLVKLANKAY